MGIPNSIIAIELIKREPDTFNLKRRKTTPIITKIICDIINIVFEITTEVIPSTIGTLCFFRKYAFIGSPAKFADGIIQFSDSPASLIKKRSLKLIFELVNAYFHPSVSKINTSENGRSRSKTFHFKTISW